jgi:UDP-N-acetylmuramoylalanine--D-glutamate ligase
MVKIDGGLAMLYTIIASLKDKKILIAGFGREGRSSLKLIRENLPEAFVGVADQNEALQAEIAAHYPEVLFYGGQTCLDSLNEFDLVLKSPGMKLPELPAKNVQISSQTDLFLAAFHSQIVGITGTKGKSTTSHLIHHLLEQAGKDAVLVGNMGRPCFDSIAAIQPDTHIVFELSAHQLQYVRHSPHIALLLNVFEEHLDYFETLEAYRQAKFNILRFAVPDDHALLDIRLKAHMPDTKARMHFVDHAQLVEVPLPISLPGRHNQFNAAMAIAAVALLGVSREVALKGITSFEGLPHRLQFAGPYKGLRFVNDSIATVPEATIAALEAWPHPDYLILGGYDRGINYDLLVDHLQHNPPGMIFYTGKAGNRIIAALQKCNYSGTLHPFEVLEEVFEFLATHAKAGQLCMLSPAAASYDKYKNFEQRGEMFLELAGKMGNEE